MNALHYQFGRALADCGFHYIVRRADVQEWQIVMAVLIKTRAAHAHEIEKPGTMRPGRSRS